jgi:hypothetical protein
VKEFLVRYDYGQGSACFLISAKSRSELERRLQSYCKILSDEEAASLAGTKFLKLELDSMNEFFARELLKPNSE